MNLTQEEILLEESILQTPLTPDQVEFFHGLLKGLEYQFWAQVNLHNSSWHKESIDQLERAVIFLLRRQILFVLRRFPENGRFEIFETGTTAHDKIATAKGKIQLWVDADPKHLKELYFQEETRRAVSGSKKLRYEEL